MREKVDFEETFALGVAGFEDGLPDAYTGVVDQDGGFAVVLLDLFADAYYGFGVCDVELVEVHARYYLVSCHVSSKSTPACSYTKERERVEEHTLRQLRRKLRNIHRNHPRNLRKPLHHLIPKPRTTPRNNHKLLLIRSKLERCTRSAQRPIIPRKSIKRVIDLLHHTKSSQNLEYRDERRESGSAIGSSKYVGSEGIEDPFADVRWAFGEDVEESSC